MTPFPDEETLKEWHSLIGPLTNANLNLAKILIDVWNPTIYRPINLNTRFDRVAEAAYELRQLRAMDRFWHIKLSQERLRTYAAKTPYHQRYVKYYLDFLDKFLDKHYVKDSFQRNCAQTIS